MNFVKQILSLITINVVGLILIITYFAYYSLGTAMFGVNSLTVIIAIARHFRKQIIFGEQPIKIMQLVLYFICLALIVELYDFMTASHITNILLSIVLSAMCGGFAILTIYKFTK